MSSFYQIFIYGIYFTKLGIIEYGEKKEIIIFFLIYVFSAFSLDRSHSFSGAFQVIIKVIIFKYKQKPRPV